jgi:PAS domain-containing protein
MWRLSTDIMLVSDFEASIVAINPAWQSLLNWHEDDLIGRSRKYRGGSLCCQAVKRSWLVFIAISKVVCPVAIRLRGAQFSGKLVEGRQEGAASKRYV